MNEVPLYALSFWFGINKYNTPPGLRFWGQTVPFLSRSCSSVFFFVYFITLEPRVE